MTTSHRQMFPDEPDVLDCIRGPKPLQNTGEVVICKLESSKIDKCFSLTHRHACVVDVVKNNLVKDNVFHGFRDLKFYTNK